MTGRQRAFNSAQEAAAQRPKAQPRPQPGYVPDPEHFLPDALVTGLVQTLGSAREARKKWERGDRLGAGIDAAFGLPDAYAAGAAIKGAIKKGGAKVFGPKNWSNPPWKSEGARQWLEKNGFVNPGEDAHHWLIPQSGWGKAIPEWFKNQPWNIKGMDKIPHRRMHGSAKVDGEWLPEFNALEKVWYGTPAYLKAVVTGAVLDAPSQPRQPSPARKPAPHPQARTNR